MRISDPAQEQLEQESGRRPGSSKKLHIFIGIAIIVAVVLMIAIVRLSGKRQQSDIHPAQLGLASTQAAPWCPEGKAVILKKDLQPQFKEVSICGYVVDDQLTLMVIHTRQDGSATTRVFTPSDREFQTWLDLLIDGGKPLDMPKDAPAANVPRNAQSI